MTEGKLRGQQGQHFFNLMTDLSRSDGGHSIKEQVSTENTVKAVYMDYLKQMTEDSEYVLRPACNIWLSVILWTYLCVLVCQLYIGTCTSNFAWKDCVIYHQLLKLETPNQSFNLVSWHMHPKKTKGLGLGLGFPLFGYLGFGYFANLLQILNLK